MPRRPSATRRTVLGGAALTVLGTTGCDLDPRSAPTPQRPAPPVDADSELVEAVVGDIKDVAGTVTALAAAYPALAAAVLPLAHLHASHLAELRPDGVTTPSPTSSGVPSPGPRAALRGLQGRERQLQRRLVTASMAAGSGELARLLAAMSAAVAQQLAVFPALDRDAEPARESSP